MQIYWDSLNKTKVGEPAVWDDRDTLLYALSVGAAVDGRSDLQYATENTQNLPQQVLPSFATVLAMKTRSSLLWEAGEFPLSKVIHASQEVIMHEHLPLQGAVQGESKITALFNLTKHAIVQVST